MPLTKRPSALDTGRTNKELLGVEIRELKEKIGHLKAYQEDTDTGGLELRLEALLRQQKEIYK